MNKLAEISASGGSAPPPLSLLISVKSVSRKNIARGMKSNETLHRLFDAVSRLMRLSLYCLHVRFGVVVLLT